MFHNRFSKKNEEYTGSTKLRDYILLKDGLELLKTNPSR